MAALPHRSRMAQAIVFTGILLIASNLRAPFTGLPPLLEDIATTFELSTFLQAVLTSLPLLAFALLSPMSAWFARILGMERALFIALLAIVVGFGLRSSGMLWGLFGGSAVIGMGIAVGNVLLPGLVKRDFPFKVAKVTGAYALVMGIAAALVSALMVPLAQILGWRGALAMFVVLPLAALLVWSTQLKSGKAHAERVTVPEQDTRIWCSPLAWQVTLFLGLNSTIYYVLIGWLPVILVDGGRTAAEAGSMHGIMQLATAVPGLFIGPILHRMRDQRMAAVVICLVSAVALLGFWLLPQWALLWSILFGLGTGAGIILGLILIALRARHVEQAASLSGMAQSMGYLLAAMGPLLIGRLHDMTDGWAVPLLLCTILAMVAAAVGLMAGRDRHVGDSKPAHCVSAVACERT